MKALVVSLAAAAALTAPGAAFSGGTPQAQVSGTVLVVPNNMMCRQGVVCNAYHGPVVFCHTLPGRMPTQTPCKTPAATVQTSAQGRYTVRLAAGYYNAYVHGIKHPWLVFAGKFSRGTNVFNIAISRTDG